MLKFAHLHWTQSTAETIRNKNVINFVFIRWTCTFFFFFFCQNNSLSLFHENISWSGFCDFFWVAPSFSPGLWLFWQALDRRTVCLTRQSHLREESDAGTNAIMLILCLQPLSRLTSLLVYGPVGPVTHCQMKTWSEGLSNTFPAPFSKDFKHAGHSVIL